MNLVAIWEVSLSTINNWDWSYKYNRTASLKYYWFYFIQSLLSIQLILFSDIWLSNFNFGINQLFFYFYLLV